MKAINLLLGMALAVTTHFATLCLQYLLEKLLTSFLLISSLDGGQLVTKLIFSARWELLILRLVLLYLENTSRQQSLEASRGFL